MLGVYMLWTSAPELVPDYSSAPSKSAALRLTLKQAAK